MKNDMARKKLTGRMVWMLLFFCLLVGAGRSDLWAEDGRGIQLVLVLDLANPTKDEQVPSLLPQAAGLLVHLLKDQDHLGLVVSGDQAQVLLPTARLTLEHRAQALKKLARLTPVPTRDSLPEVVEQSLEAFQTDGPTRRVLFLLTDGTWEKINRENNSKTSKTREIAAQAQKAGVAIFVASLAPTAPSIELQTLASSSGGRFWKVNATSDLPLTCLRFYEHLEQPQEAPINGEQVLLDKWVRQAVVVAARSVPGKGVVLTSPRGAKITPRTRVKTIRWVACQAYDLITISHPHPGVWSLARARPEDSRVFLDTEVTLTAAGTPREVGEDEVLMVTVALQSHDKTQARPDLLTGTQFRAELHISQNISLTAELQTPQPRGSPASPPESRVGQFPPLHQEGEGTLRLLALGKNFQRQVSLPITITRPWYGVVPAAGETPGAPPLRFQPARERHPEQVGGTLTLKSAQGSLAGAFINPAPGAEVILDQLPGCSDPCLADLHLTGTAPGGRPLVIASSPRRLGAPGKVIDPPPDPSPKPIPGEKTQVSGPLSLTHKIKRRWVWLALCGVGLAVFLTSAAFLVRWRWEADGPEDEEGSGGSSQTNILRLKAQVEALDKGKAQLQDALKEKNSQLDLLQAEKADLQAALERVSEKSQANIKSLEELEKKLEEADQEAEGVRQEYMALYARNQREKETYKKK